MLVRPKSLGLVSIEKFVDGIDAQAFEIPFPTPVSLVRRIAGGGVYDFNYGEDEVLIPKPFGITFVIQGNTAWNLSQNYDQIFSEPRFGGMIGSLQQLVVARHGSPLQEYMANVRVGLPVDALSGNIYTYDVDKIRANVKCTFFPIELFSVVP